MRFAKPRRNLQGSGKRRPIRCVQKDVFDEASQAEFTKRTRELSKVGNIDKRSQCIQNSLSTKRRSKNCVPTVWHLLRHKNSVSKSCPRVRPSTVLGAACGGLVHSRGDRTVTTPNRPAAYPANAECDWTLDVQKGHRARIAFRGRFDLETTADCSADFVQVSFA